MILPASEDVRLAIDEALKFAHKINKQDDLIQKLFRLGHGYYNNNKEYVCVLYKDFAKYSFEFALFNIVKDDLCNRVHNIIKYEETPWMTGGLIYHGPLEDNSKPETFSVSLTNTTGWSIHT